MNEKTLYFVLFYFNSIIIFLFSIYSDLFPIFPKNFVIIKLKALHFLAKIIGNNCSSSMSFGLEDARCQYCANEQCFEGRTRIQQDLYQLPWIGIQAILSLLQSDSGVSSFLSLISHSSNKLFCVTNYYNVEFLRFFLNISINYFELCL